MKQPLWEEPSWEKVPHQIEVEAMDILIKLWQALGYDPDTTPAEEIETRIWQILRAHPPIDELLSYAHGELWRTKIELVNAHVQACPQCSKKLQLLLEGKAENHESPEQS